jgi:hypothetical protein
MIPIFSDTDGFIVEKCLGDFLSRGMIDSVRMKRLWVARRAILKVLKWYGKSLQFSTW